MISYKWNKGGTIYDFLERSFWSDKSASEYLENLWYDGIHYFWWIDWEAYVIFNPDKMEIQSHEKYQKAWDINSPAFKKRFGDWENDPKNASKIVNKDWTPRIVYHWTKADFNVFKNRELGFHFWSTKAQAKVKSWNKWKIMQAYLNIRNPIDVYGDMGIWTANYTFWDRLKEKWIITEDERKSFKYKEDRLSDRILIDILEKKWYDGVIYDNWWEWASEAKSYIAFRPEQIKSATDNIGTYDANNEDIRYQRVYHWSPNEFGNFDSSHMWEGEWNQAHGRWHYVAVDPETARRYAQDKFYRNEIELKWRTMARVDDTRDIPYALRSLYRDIFNTFAMWYYDVEEEAKNVLDRTKKEYEETIEYYEELIRNKTKPSVDMTEEDLKVMQESREKALEEYKEALEFIEDLKPEDIKIIYTR